MNAFNLTFLLSAIIAIISTFQAITQLNAIRALLYFIVSLLATAIIFFILGAPFAAALEVITYAGAIMVLFTFVTLLLNQGPISMNQEKQWLTPKVWIGPTLLALILLCEFLYFYLLKLPILKRHPFIMIEPQKVGFTLFGNYMIGVELASMILLAGLIGAFHIGNRTIQEKDLQENNLKESTDSQRGFRRPFRVVAFKKTDRKAGQL